MLTDRDLRSMLATLEVGLEPDSDVRARLLTAAAAARTRGRSRLSWPVLAAPAFGIRTARLALLGAVLLGLLFGLLALAGTRPDRPLTDAAPPARVAAAFDVGRPPTGLEIDNAGTPWVVVGSELVRVEPAGGRMGPRVDLGTGSVVGFRSTGAALWVATDDGRLRAVDAATGVVTATTTFAQPTALAIDDSSRTPGLVLISADRDLVADVDGSALTARWSVQLPGSPFLVGEGGSRVVVAYRPAGASGRFVLASLDPRTGVTESTIELAGVQPPSAMVVERAGAKPGRVWLLSPGSDAVVGVDLDRGTPTSTIHVGPDPAILLERADGALVVGFGSPDAVTRIAVVRTDTGRVDRFSIRQDGPGTGQGVTDMAVSASSEATSSANIGSLWLALDWSAAPSIVRVDSVGMR